MDSANFPTFRTKASMPSLPPRTSETRAVPKSLASSSNARSKPKG